MFSALLLLVAGIRKPWLRRFQVLVSYKQRIGQRHRSQSSGKVFFFFFEGKREYRQEDTLQEKVVGSDQMAQKP
jgi:hypothetical protein